LVIPILTQLHVEIAQLRFIDSTVKEVKQKRVDSIKTRFSDIESGHFYSIAKLLDPRVKDTCFIKESNRINAKNVLLTETIKKAEEFERVSQPIQTNEEASEPANKKRKTVFQFIKEQQLEKPDNSLSNVCSVEIDSYFREAVTETIDSIKWWQQNKFKYPNLYRLVKRYVCIPATSCPSERIFSKAGEIICKKRSRLSPKHVNQLVFLNHNLHALI
jgi:hypothetical protein